jgi:nitroreductase
MSDLPEGLTRADLVRAVDHVIRSRRTRKILDGPGLPPDVPTTAGAGGAGFEAAVRECLALAGLAPFHYPRGDVVPEPWRFTVLFRPGIEAFGARVPLGGKLPAILAGAGAMVQVTYLAEEDPARADIDREHAAAAAAAVENLLLAAEARGIGSYWSTASFLSAPEARAACGIPEGERSLGTVFLGRPLSPDREATEGIAGKMRGRRTPPEAGWVRVVVPGAG